jgi:hypothetical protein
VVVDWEAAVLAARVDWVVADLVDSVALADLAEEILAEVADWQEAASAALVVSKEGLVVRELVDLMQAVYQMPSADVVREDWGQGEHLAVPHLQHRD